MSGTLFKEKKIICAGMNLVTSLSLAKAVFDNNGIPTMLLPNMWDKHSITLQKLQEYSAGRDYIVGLGTKELMQQSLVDSLILHPPTHIELLDGVGNYHISIDKLRGMGVKIIGKCTSLPKPDYIDAVSLKLPNGAGQCPIKEHKVLIVKEYITKNNLGLILSGNIHDSSDILSLRSQYPEAYYALGTRFALCEESPLSSEVKFKIINNKHKYKSINTSPISCRNMIIFGNNNLLGSDNNTKQLMLGLYSNENVGICYIGKGINKITVIEPIASIFKELTL